MNLRHLRYFVKIVEAGSFSGAAAAIHVAQPALSQQIAELEAELGVSLLLRTPRGVCPTPAGEALCREAAAILRQIEQLPGVVRSSGGDPEGAVSLGMTFQLTGSYSGAFIEACRVMLPKVSLSFMSEGVVRLKSQIAAGLLDIAVTFDDEEIRGLTFRPLFRQRLYLIQREASASDIRSISIRDLAAVPLLLPGHPHVTRVRMESIFAAAGVTPHIVTESNVLSVLLSAVEAGIGGTVLAKGDFSDMPGHRGLVAIAIEPPIHFTASIVTSSTAPLSRAAEAVRDLLVSFFASHLREASPPGAEWIGGEPAISKRNIPISR